MVLGLIVDDNVQIRQALTRYLRLPDHVGLQIDWLAAASEADATALIARQPRFVIVDIALTGDVGNRDGVSVAYAAREVTPYVYALTGMELEEDVQAELFDLGVYVFRKPFEPPKLLGTIVRHALQAHTPPKPTASAIRVAARALRNLGAPLDQNADIALREAVGDTVLDCDRKKLRAAKALGVERRWIDRHLPLDWPDPKKKNG